MNNHEYSAPFVCFFVYLQVSVCVCVCVYPEIQSCAGSGRLCLVLAPHLALCAGRCGPDDQHIDAGRRERYGRREGVQSTPPWALRFTMKTDSQGERESHSGCKREQKTQKGKRLIKEKRKGFRREEENSEIEKKMTGIVKWNERRREKR